MKKFFQPNIFFLLILSIGVLYCTGCEILSREEFHPVEYHRLSPPPSLAIQNVDIDVSNFKSPVCTTSKMIYTTGNYNIIIDEYNKWLHTPHLLLSQYLRRAFLNNDTTISPKNHQQQIKTAGKNIQLQLKGTLFSLDINIPTKTLIITGKYEIRDCSGVKSLVKKDFAISVPIKKNTPTSFAEAYSKAAMQLALKIRKHIFKIISKN